MAFFAIHLTANRSDHLPVRHCHEQAHFFEALQHAVRVQYCVGVRLASVLPTVPGKRCFQAIGDRGAVLCTRLSYFKPALS